MRQLITLLLLLVSFSSFGQTYDTTKGTVVYFVGARMESENGIKVDSVWNEVEEVPCPNAAKRSDGNMYSTRCAVMHYGSVEHRKTIRVSAEYYMDLDIRKYYQFIPEDQLQD